MLYSAHLLTDMTTHISNALFHFIFDFLIIFMVIMNIKKIELINATESCLSNTVSIN